MAIQSLSTFRKHVYLIFFGAHLTGVSCLCYVYASVLWVTRDQKLKRGGMLYKAAQNKWDLLLKLYMGYFSTIKINDNVIVVSVCVFSMVKPVQCLLNMDRKLKLSISVIVST